MLRRWDVSKGVGRALVGICLKESLSEGVTLPSWTPMPQDMSSQAPSPGKSIRIWIPPEDPSEA